jgi:hypothetical protein
VPFADRLLGTLVHRMLQRGVAVAGLEDLAATARALARPEELVEITALDDPGAAIRQAAAAFQSIAARADVQTLFASGERLHEVPFSFRRDGRILRGTMDCLILQPPSADGPQRVTVVEFKTGRKHDAHQAQLDVYVDAARVLFPAADVSGLLIYA